jgi:acetoin utilization deacetylase AcuC-like enzyme
LSSEVGGEGAEGFNLNIPFPTQNGEGTNIFDILCFEELNLMLFSEFGDSEYLGSFYSIVVPIGQAFRPDIVILAAGLLCFLAS